MLQKVTLGLLLVLQSALAFGAELSVDEIKRSYKQTLDIKKSLSAHFGSVWMCDSHVLQQPPELTLLESGSPTFKFQPLVNEKKEILGYDSVPSYKGEAQAAHLTLSSDGTREFLVEDLPEYGLKFASIITKGTENIKPGSLVLEIAVTDKSYYPKYFEEPETKYPRSSFFGDVPVKGFQLCLPSDTN